MDTTLDIAGLEKVTELLQFLNGNVASALSAATNNTLFNMRAQAKRDLKNHLNLKAKTIHSRTFIQKATPQAITASIKIKSKHIPLLDSGGDSYGAKRFGSRGGVRFVVRKDKGQEIFKHAFIMKGKVFVQKNYPIAKGGKRQFKVLYGAGVAAAFDKAGILQITLDVAKDRFMINLHNQVSRLLKKQNPEAELPDLGDL